MEMDIQTTDYQLIEYDRTDPSSIEEYAQKLIGKTFRQVCEADESRSQGKKRFSDYGVSEVSRKKRNKGNLGQIIEEQFFHYECNGEARADFPEAGVELKVTPFRQSIKGEISAKERLKLSMIDYNEVVWESFEDSHLWNKAKVLLLVFYLYDKDIASNLDYIIRYARLFTPSERDLMIIKNDYYYIVSKIKAGKAHELSERDTLYLGAAPSASTSSVRRKQPFSDVPAKPRAFAFKSAYMTYVLNNYIVPKSNEQYEPIIKEKKDLEGHTFEELIVSRIDQYAGKTDKYLCGLFGRDYNNNKAQWSDLAYRMLGIKSNRAEEFAKAQIVVKAIRIEENGKMRENSPLPACSFSEIIKEKWEESQLYTYLNETRFLFVIYKRQGSSYILKGSQLWGISDADLNKTVYEGWKMIRETLIKGVVLDKAQHGSKIIVRNNFPGKDANRIVHIRPHTRKRFYVFEDGSTIGDGCLADTDELPDGRRMTKQSFWLNNNYIISQLRSELLK